MPVADEFRVFILCDLDPLALSVFYANYLGNVRRQSLVLFFVTLSFSLLNFARSWFIFDLNPKTDKTKASFYTFPCLWFIQRSGPFLVCLYWWGNWLYSRTPEKRTQRALGEMRWLEQPKRYSWEATGDSNSSCFGLSIAITPHL